MRESVCRVVADIGERAQEDFAGGESRVDIAAPALASDADEPGAGDFFGGIDYVSAEVDIDVFCGVVFPAAEEHRLLRVF